MCVSKLSWDEFRNLNYISVLPLEEQVNEYVIYSCSRQNINISINIDSCNTLIPKIISYDSCGTYDNNYKYEE